MICQSGKEPGIREAIDYLDRQYGMPSRDIKAVAIEGEIGRPILITVTVYMQNEPKEVL